jgi:hypothetical protein
MTDLKKAAQQALERLMLHHRTWDARDDLNAITALKAALEQPEQEPVEPLKGWKLNHARKHPDEEGVAEIGYLDPEDDRFAPILTVDTGLYYQDAQALPLVVAILSMLSAHPPRREWRSLSEEEIGELMRDSCGYPMCPNGDDLAFARAVEAALRRKNYG